MTPPIGNGGFDSLNELFVAQASKPKHLTDINLRALKPFQRALLVIDGTVTKFIEAYKMEPIEVVRIAQQRQLLPTDHLWLEAPGGTEVVARQVMLRGEYSQRIYAYAVSLIVPERLKAGLTEELDLDGEGVGRILLNSRMEQFREILWYGKERLGDLPEAISHLRGLEFVSRTYRIIVEGRPAILISEKFPADEDGLPSHH